MLESVYVVAVLLTVFVIRCQLVPDLRKLPAGRGYSVETDQFPSRDIRYHDATVSFRFYPAVLYIGMACVVRPYCCSNWMQSVATDKMAWSVSLSVCL